MIKEIIASTRTVVVYESSHRILKFLQQLIDNGGSTLKLVVGRELTKLFESVYRGVPGEILRQLVINEKQQKGEFVIVISK